MKISIITVVFNGESTLEDSINSVISQNYKDLEYIIIDGNSTDNTINIINSYKDHISYFISETDGGIYDAMNKGIALASGDVVGILNSDDLYQSPNVLNLVMEQFKNDNSIDIVYGDLVYVKSYNVNHVVRYWKSKPFNKYFFEMGNVPPHPSLFLKRKIYDEAGMFNLKYRLAADYEYMLRIFKNYKYNSKYINETIVRMRLGGATNKNISNILKQNREIYNAWSNNNLSLPFFLMPLRIIKRVLQFF